MAVSLQTPAEQAFGGDAVKIVARGPQGSFAILPNHADAVSPLLTGVVTLTLAGGSELFFGIDDGLIVKQGRSVRIGAFRAVSASSLAEIRHIVAPRFEEFADRERLARTALARLEAGAMRRFAELLEPGA